MESVDTLCIDGQERFILTYMHNGSIFYRASDIAQLLKVNNIRAATKNMNPGEKIKYKSQNTNGGPQICTYISFNALKKIIVRSKTLVRTQLAKHFGIDIVHSYACTKEQENKVLIMTVFHGEEMVPEYFVDGYRIDLYFPKYALAIECDEPYHQNQSLKDAVREDYIRAKLGCTFIRYRPCDEDFNIHVVINQIFRHIKSWMTASSTTT